MTLELIIKDMVIQTWDIPEEEISTPALDWETRTKYRIEAVNDWVDKMRRVYSDLILKSGYQVEMRITFQSKINTLEIPDDETEKISNIHF
ncbi:MAG TPA: hypothetical protein PK339_12565 [Flavitalea sp.]|nr:hypothetical protein [Flavitalea sp.]